MDAWPAKVELNLLAARLRKETTLTVKGVADLGRSIPARIAIIAMTTSSSIKVKPRRTSQRGWGELEIGARIILPRCPSIAGAAF